jgi:hypothetical protein
MSRWRIVVRDLFDHGPSSARQVSLRTGLDARYGLEDARRLGLAESPGRGPSGSWKLTQKAVDWCEGRLAMSHRPWSPQGGRPPTRFVPTWLSSLPRDIRINQGAEA